MKLGSDGYGFFLRSLDKIFLLSQINSSLSCGIGVAPKSFMVDSDSGFRTQVTRLDFQNKGTRLSPARLSFDLKVPLCKSPSIINSVPFDRIVLRAY